MVVVVVMDRWPWYRFLPPYINQAKEHLSGAVSPIRGFSCTVI
jgi:hypothetical protein